ncbi:MAG TPA: hypothetical protein PLC03_12415, partial [Microthrixaceae bacterium]|nr:hypothetical protein [Microthrixaceae bacterium]
MLDIMRRWTEQPGFPLLEVSSIGGGKYRFKQSRFLASGEAGGDAVWPLPLIVRVGEGREVREQRFLLTERETTLDLGRADWLWPNG